MNFLTKRLDIQQLLYFKMVLYFVYNYVICDCLTQAIPTGQNRIRQNHALH